MPEINVSRKAPFTAQKHALAANSKLKVCEERNILALKTPVSVRVRISATEKKVGEQKRTEQKNGRRPYQSRDAAIRKVEMFVTSATTEWLENEKGNKSETSL
ncbi:hypothetical protein AVEN_181539-1 [Araneus ventricosus]|uniref:Uncharacterized protein n=1 Tax=Araneus ventricosus TaxID=182803 RepID=A0A4Y2V557_ARAVE|nr:hypothetical protein AVEN_236700-1 [Araneus ventricosus]GBO19625.1 hypothetical protein AVEN_181539-1 [Araneus ventricosus]